MQGNVSAVMLAGTILPTPFQESLGVPVLCLPIGGRGTILDAWRRLYSSVDDLDSIELVVKSEKELTSAESVVRAERRRHPEGATITVSRDPGDWRGVAGVLHDLTRELPTDAIVFVSEAHCQPPGTLEPLIDALGPDVYGAVGTTPDDEPAGVYVFRRSAFDGVSSIGYCDLKEQLLPQLYADGKKVVAAAVAKHPQRVRDLESYLNALRWSLREQGDSIMRISSQASVSGSAIMDGFCIIEPGAVVEDGAVVHDSVVLSGATVGGGAVVSRSVIGAKATVAPRQRVIRKVAAAGASEADVQAMMEADETAQVQSMDETTEHMESRSGTAAARRR